MQGKFKDDIRLQDGDVVLVDPYESLIQITGKVKRPMFYEMKPAETVSTLLDYAAELVRNIFEGNQYYKEGTAKGDLLLAFLKRIGFILKKIELKDKKGDKLDLYDVLKNTAGNYDIDDYNATLILK